MRLTYKALIAILFVVVAGIIGHVIFYYNYLTDLRFDVVTAMGNVSSAVQCRSNLLPVLIESVASFVQHEDNVFNRTVDARADKISASRKRSEELRKAIEDPKKKGEKQGVLQDVLQRIIAIAEQYPSLKTSESFQLMMTQVSEAEARILERRIKYNEAVNLYTTAMTMFPGNIYSSVFDFPFYDYFTESKGSEWPAVAISTKKMAQNGGGGPDGD